MTVTKHLAHKIPLIPTDEQRRIFDLNILGSASAYNLAVTVAKEFWSAGAWEEHKPNKWRWFHPGWGDLSTICTKHRQAEPFADFFRMLHGVVPNAAVTDYWQAHRRHEKDKLKTDGRRKARRPRVKNVYEHNSFCVKYSPTHNAKFTDDGDAIATTAKLGETIQLKERPRFPDHPIKKLTISRIGYGKRAKYYASCYHGEEEVTDLPDLPTETIGIDMNMDGHSVSFGPDKPRDVLGKQLKPLGKRYLRIIGKRQKKLSRMQNGRRPPGQKRIDRMQPGSKNQKKAIRRRELWKPGVGKRYKSYAKIASAPYQRWNNKKTAIIEEQTARITERADLIGIQEDNYQAMAVKRASKDGKTKKRPSSAKSILMVAPYRFITRIRQKITAKGGTYHKVDRWEATTKTCYKCGHKNNVEIWQQRIKCEGCGLYFKRQENAPDNIRRSTAQAHDRPY